MNYRLAEFPKCRDAGEEFHARSGTHHCISIITVNHTLSRSIIDHHTESADMRHMSHEGVYTTLKCSINGHCGVLIRSNRSIALTTASANSKGDDCKEYYTT